MDREKIRDAGISAILSFAFNGLGQIYNGEIKKGLFIIFLSSLSMLIFILGAIVIGLWIVGKLVLSGWVTLGFSLFGLGVLLICIIGIWSIVDAYNVARRQ